jgi:hypothetical protein
MKYVIYFDINFPHATVQKFNMQRYQHSLVHQ